MDKMNAEQYAELPYHIELVYDRDDVGNVGWVAEIEELPGCISQGGTAEEAVSRAKDAIVSWVSIANEDGKSIPKPRSENNYSGRFIVRVPKELHARLVKEARNENISLNSYAMSVLAGSIGWRSE